MKSHPLRHIGVALASTLVLSSLALAPIGEPATAQAATTSVTIDTSSKDAVKDAYLNLFLPNVDVATGWTGDRSTWVAGGACDVGVTPQATRDATVNVINYFRALAGLASVAEDPAATARAQQAALIQAVNAPPGPPNHYPPNTWICWTQDAYDSSGDSNLAWGQSTGGESIVDYMSDDGIPNVGHRGGVLYPRVGTVGVGIVGPAGAYYPATYPIGYALEWQNGFVTTTRQAVAWPSKGYFPAQNLPDSGSWSYSLSNTSFNAASGATQVSVTKQTEGSTTVTPILVSGVSSYQDGSGWIPDSTLVWTMPKLDTPDSGTVDIYHVTITGAVTDSYDVKVFSVQPKVTVKSVSISGGTAIGSTLTATVASTDVNPIDATLSYVWYAGTKQVGTGKTYTTTVADAGQTMTVQVSGTKSGWDPSDTVTSNSVTVDSLLPLTGKVYSKDGTPVDGVVISYNNVTCDPFTDITSPDISGTVTVGADGVFTFGTMSGQCYEIGVASPTGLIVNSGGSEGGEVGHSFAGTTGYSVYVSQVGFDRVTIPSSVTVGTSIPATLIDYQPDTATFTYQWYRDDGTGTGIPVVIPGATGASYTATAEDLGQQLTVRATATSGTGSITRTSNPATVGMGPAFTFTPPIYADGTPATTASVGQKLTTSVEDVPAGWTPAYQWLSDDGVAGGTPKEIMGAKSDSYTLLDADLHTNISVRVTLTQDGYGTSTNTSASVAITTQRTVTFDPQNGDTTTVKTVADGSTVTLPDAPTKDGYDFGGWFLSDGTTAFTATTPVTADITVTAKWTEQITPPAPTYTVTYQGNGGTGAVIDQATYKAGDPATVLPNTFVRDGYTFAGWKDAAGTSYAAGDTIQMTADIQLTAQWNEIVKPPVTTYTVTYRGNGGTGAVIDQATYTSGSQAQAKANTFVRDGYTFTVWNTSADGTGTSYLVNSTITITGNVTLFAQWQKNNELPNVEFTLTYDANGGTGTMESTKYESGSAATALESGFTREGYTFAGWNTAKDGTGTGYSAAATFVMNDNVTLYAQWVANTAPETPAGPNVNSGGRTSNSSMLLVLQLGLIAAGVAVFRLRKLV